MPDPPTDRSWNCLRAPAFTIVVVLTLRLGIGATTAILTLTDAILVRSLTADRPEELVVVHAYGMDGNRTNLSHPLFERLRHEPASAGMFAALDGNQTAVLTLE